MLEYYTDGAASNNKTRCGGWAWVYEDENNRVFMERGSATNTTNNRMEMQALIAAMEDAVRLQETATFYTDSAYLANCFNQKWYDKWEKNNWMTSKRTPVLNVDLWVRLLELYRNNNFKVVHVKGHSTNKLNNLADKFAVEARKMVEDNL